MYINWTRFNKAFLNTIRPCSKITDNQESNVEFEKCVKKHLGESHILLKVSFSSKAKMLNLKVKEAN